ncbi:MAG: porin [Bacteroidota bacterium]
MTKSNLSTGVKYKEDLNYLDERIAASFTLYPKPFGLQAEYTIGKGPEFDKYSDSISVQNLNGGYILASYMVHAGKQLFIPFSRIQYYNGGKKVEKDARSYEVKELEIGIEWQPIRQFEFVAMYTISERRYEDFVKQDNLQKGNLLRLQLQVNF